MSAFVKKYPRAKVSRHARINGWVIDLIQREGARPKRVAATYATAAFADRAARVKLGAIPPAVYKPLPQHVRPLGSARVTVEPEARPAQAPQAPADTRRTRAPHGERSTGTCTPCGRPMRPAGTKAADYPGTTLRQRDGICQTCYQKAKREGAAA
jgi:hypothetical protein